ncbi:hypothetical protein BSKO_06978 [Bryopsis sp. KO-2023]|nr:hypothetical protein BSKO_06978 [Bryopsis sp. KO-2023]
MIELVVLMLSMIFFISTLYYKEMAEDAKRECESMKRQLAKALEATDWRIDFLKNKCTRLEEFKNVLVEDRKKGFEMMQMALKYEKRKSEGLEEEASKAAKKNSELEGRVKVMSDVLAEVEVAFPALEKEVYETKEKLKEKEEELVLAEEEALEATGRISELEGRVEEMSGVLAEVKVAFPVLEKDFYEIMEEKEEELMVAREDLEEANQEVENTKEQLAEAEAKLESTEEKYAGLRRTHSEALEMLVRLTNGT